MRDLEIRGAGNLLGEAQSGHMEAVGYDMYCKMLNEAVLRLKGEGEEESFTTTIDLNIDAYIPESYIRNEYQKLDIYKRIAAIDNEEEMDDMTEELIDRFGDIPKKVQQLLHIAALKGLAHSAYVTAVEQKGQIYVLPCTRGRRSILRKSLPCSQAMGRTLHSGRRSRHTFCIRKKAGAGRMQGRVCSTQCAECWKISGGSRFRDIFVRVVS